MPRRRPRTRPGDLFCFWCVRTQELFLASVERCAARRGARTTIGSEGRGARIRREEPPSKPGPSPEVTTARLPLSPVADPTSTALGRCGLDGARAPVCPQEGHHVGRGRPPAPGVDELADQGADHLVAERARRDVEAQQAPGAPSSASGPRERQSALSTRRTIGSVAAVPARAGRRPESRARQSGCRWRRAWPARRAPRRCAS